LNPKIILFSDLDGTVLNKNYSYLQIQPTLQKLLSLNVSIVLTSSKTRAEIEFYRQQLGITEPFISENGSAIIIPKGYFKTQITPTLSNADYEVIQLGVDYSTLRNKLKTIREKTHSTLLGFGDMTLKEIAQDSGLPLELAALAKNREYDEPFKIICGDEQEVIQAINDQGLSYTKGGQYFHLLGKTDKGKAVATLKNLYLQEFGEIVTLGIGDGPNDLSMLKIVDKPFFIADSKDAFRMWQDILAVAKTFSSVQ
jgi:mannosyl-3-phosphoglycerate phosphatase